MVPQNQLQLLSKVRWEVWSIKEVLVLVISLSLLGTRDSFFFFCQLVYSWQPHFVSDKLLGLNNPLVT